MGTIHELLILLRSYTKKYMRDYELKGLCAIVNLLYNHDIIIFDEYTILNNYISRHRPIYKHNLYFVFRY